jgi:hypothetical protein
MRAICVDEDVDRVVIRPTTTQPNEIYFFTYDVYRVGPGGTRPGEVVFLTGDCVYDVDKGCTEWRVQSFMEVKKYGSVQQQRFQILTRSETRGCQPETWFEKEQDLERNCIY